MIRLSAISAVLAALLLSGCAAPDFLAVSVSRQADGGIYRIRQDQARFLSKLPTLNCLIRDPETGFYYGTLNRMPGSKDKNGAVAVLKRISPEEFSVEQIVEVNGRMEPGTHEIKEGDRIELVSYYTVGQLAAFMDVVHWSIGSRVLSNVFVTEPAVSAAAVPKFWKSTVPVFTASYICAPDFPNRSYDAVRPSTPSFPLRMVFWRSESA